MMKSYGSSLLLCFIVLFSISSLPTCGAWTNRGNFQRSRRTVAADFYRMQEQQQQQHEHRRRRRSWSLSSQETESQHRITTEADPAIVDLVNQATTTTTTTPNGASVISNENSALTIFNGWNGQEAVDEEEEESQRFMDEMHMRTALELARSTYVCKHDGVCHHDVRIYSTLFFPSNYTYIHMINPNKPMVAFCSLFHAHNNMMCLYNNIVTTTRPFPNPRRVLCW